MRNRPEHAYTLVPSSAFHIQIHVKRYEGEEALVETSQLVSPTAKSSTPNSLPRSASLAL